MSRPPIFHFEYCLTVQDPSDGEIVIEDGTIKSVAINFLWVYFFHETIVAIRHQTDKWSKYADLDDLLNGDYEFRSHTLKEINKDIFTVIGRDFNGDKDNEIEYLPLDELQRVGMALLGDEVVAFTEEGFHIADKTDAA